MPAATRLSIAAPCIESTGGDLRARIEDDARILDGHYPEFGIVPGAILVELAVEAARRVLPPESAAPSCTVVSARFLAPVLPGECVTFSTRLRDADGATVARVEARTRDGSTCAAVRIRYAGAVQP